MKILAKNHICNHRVIGAKTFNNILIGSGKLPGLSRNGAGPIRLSEQRALLNRFQRIFLIRWKTCKQYWRIIHYNNDETWTECFSKWFFKTVGLLSTSVGQCFTTFCIPYFDVFTIINWNDWTVVAITNKGMNYQSLQKFIRTCIKRTQVSEGPECVHLIRFHCVTRKDKLCQV